jgi:hypothetical protein
MDGHCTDVMLENKKKKKKENKEVEKKEILLHFNPSDICRQSKVANK